MTAHVSPSIQARHKRNARNIVRSFLWLFDHWLLIFSTLFGIMMVAPFLAPLFMHLGWTGAAQLVYTIYSFLCHQMAQRCFFLFGPQPMYNAAQLPLTLTGSNMVSDMLTVRAFIGNASMGWKVAWSDRMVYMYGAVWLGGILYAIVNRRHHVRPLKLVGFILLLLPMGIDGGTHWLSDMNSGLVSGFRYDNQWLATLTGNIFPHWFYYGDAFGSFNSWMRLITGLLFGIAIVWFAFPYLNAALQESATILREKLEKAQSRDARESTMPQEAIS